MYIAQVLFHSDSILCMGLFLPIPFISITLPSHLSSLSLLSCLNTIYLCLYIPEGLFNFFTLPLPMLWLYLYRFSLSLSLPFLSVFIYTFSLCLYLYLFSLALPIPFLSVSTYISVGLFIFFSLPLWSSLYTFYISISLWSSLYTYLLSLSLCCSGSFDLFSLSLPTIFPPQIISL